MNSATQSPLVFVTGAAGGIGSVVLTSLNTAGLHVVGADRHDADLSRYEDIEKLVARTVEHGPLAWVVFAHGFIDSETDFVKEQPEDIAVTFAINTVAVVQLTKLLLPHVQKGFVFISSTAALSPNGRYAAYSASKAAVNAFATALAKNDMSRTYITVCPGPTNTPMRQKIDANASSKQAPDIVADVITTIVTGTGAFKSGDIIIVRDGEVSKHKD